MAGPPSDEAGLDAAVARLLDRAQALAESPLSGINEAAAELAELSGDDRRVIEHALRAASQRVRADPGRTSKQIESLIRRAIEVGMWRWEWPDTKPVP